MVKKLLFFLLITITFLFGMNYIYAEETKIEESEDKQLVVVDESTADVQETESVGKDNIEPEQQAAVNLEDVENISANLDASSSDASNENQNLNNNALENENGQFGENVQLTTNDNTKPSDGIINVHSFAVDENNSHISLNGNYTNSFSVYFDEEGNPSTVKDIENENIDYSTYTKILDNEVVVGTNGSGMVYIYNRLYGMYYIRVDKSTIPSSIIDSNSRTWRYVGTRIETEYVWRNGPHDGKTHKSQIYNLSDSSYNSIPEVIGTYLNYDGNDEELKNGYLEFFIYNIYEMETGTVEISKTVTVNGNPTTSNVADGTYTFQIWDYEENNLIDKKADGSSIGELTIIVKNGVAQNTLTVDGLPIGQYVIREIGSTNTATIIDKSVEGFDTTKDGIVVTVSNDVISTANFNNKYETRTLSVHKEWVLAEGDTAEPDCNLEVTLYANGEATTHVVTLNRSNNWTASVANLPKYLNGNEIDYYWSEGITPYGYYLTGYVENGDSATITNTHVKYDLTMTYKGEKNWDTDGDTTTPPELSVKLYKYTGQASVDAAYALWGEATDQERQVPEGWIETEYLVEWVKEGNTWKYVFRNVPVFDEDGNPIYYRASENPIPYGYTRVSEEVEQTYYELGSIVVRNGNHHSITTNNQLIWDLDSYIDLPFAIVKGTSNQDAYIWTPRAATPAEKRVIWDWIEAYDKGQTTTEDGSHAKYKFKIPYESNDWLVGNVSLENSGHGKFTAIFTPDQDNPASGKCIIQFSSTSVWAQFMWGHFEGGADDYKSGQTNMTNKAEYVTPEITGIKTWNVTSDTLPANPVLRLTRTITKDGQVQAPEIVNVTPIWTQVDGTTNQMRFTYSNLPKYDQNGNEYTYHVTEASFEYNGHTYIVSVSSDGTSYVVTKDNDSADEFTTTQEETTNNDGSKDIIITNTQIVNFEFIKSWLDGALEEIVWPEGQTITVVLNAYKSGDESKTPVFENMTFTLSPENIPQGWSVEVSPNGKTNIFKIGNLQAMYEGVPVIYYVAENSIEDYVTTYSNDDYVLDGGTITNRYNPFIKIIVNKTWSDENNQDGIRPTTAVIKLQADGVDVDGKTITVPTIDGQVVVWDNLPKYNNGERIVYTIVEVLPTNSEYTSTIKETSENVFMVTNSHIPHVVDVEVSKQWKGNPEQDGLTQPISVSVELYAGNTLKDTQVLNESNNWSYKWEKLAENSNGTPIEYTVREVLEGQDLISEEETPGKYYYTIEGSMADGFVITNTYITKVVDVEVSKQWKGNPEQDGLTQPTSVSVELYAGNTLKDTQVLNESNNWSYKWEKLAENSNGTPIEYTVREVLEGQDLISEEETPGKYYYTIEGTMADGFVITNTYITKVVDVEVSKQWKGNPEQDGLTQPTSVSVELYAGNTLKDTQVLNESNNWSYKWEKLAENSNGTPIEYTVREVLEGQDLISEEETPGKYYYTIKGTMADGFVITNTYINDIVDVTVTKVWEDNDNQDGIRPTELVVILSNGTEVTLTADENWTAKIEGLPKYADGKEIEYTWTENELPEGYSLKSNVTNGLITTITNLHETATTDVTVTKVWEDYNNHDKIRPDEIEITLYANGKEIETVKLNESNDWSYKWEKLDVKSNGKDIEYTVSEKEVEGYNSKITGNMKDGFVVTNTRNAEGDGIPPTINPKTQDNIYTYLFLLLISLFGLFKSTYLYVKNN